MWKRYWEPLTVDCVKKIPPWPKLTEELVASGFNVKRCSKNLHLHYNTIRNRIDELESMLNIKITDHQHRLGLTLAYHIDKGRRK